MKKKRNRLVEKVKDCSKCNNERHVIVGGKNVRCACYNTGLFITLWDDAEGDEEQVDLKIVAQLKKDFRNNATLLHYSLSRMERGVYENSALYLATHTLHTARAFTDIEIVDMVFHKADEEKSSFIIGRVTCYDLVVIHIGVLQSKQYISNYIMEILFRRKQLGLKTLVLAPSDTHVYEKYGKDDSLKNFLLSLGETGAVI